jgi:hypothetical protein
MSQDIKEIIKQEYIKCATDPVYFAKKYVYIVHPTRGRVQFNLYPFQEDVIKLLQKEDYSIILKSRQLGISTLVALYSLWIMLFTKDKNILVVCTKTDTAKNMVTKVKFMHDNLPSWLRTGKPDENNKLTFKLKNGSQIKAVSAAGDSGRSEAVSLLIMDEAAFIPNAEELWGSAQQTLSTGGGCIALSTPNGTGNWFHQQWAKAELSQTKFLPIKLPWYVHPERNQTWRDEQTELLGPKTAAQECFSGDVVIYTINGPKHIKNIKVGDKVLSHDGTYNKVIRTIEQYSDDVYTIFNSVNHLKKHVTSNHPFYNQNNEWETVDSLNKTNNLVQLFPKIEPQSSPLHKIDLLDHIKSNSPESFPLKYDNQYIWLTKTSYINRYIDADYDLGFIIGCFLSEGSLSKNKVEFSFNGKTERNGFPLEIERILEYKFNINQFNYYTSKKWEGSSKLYIKNQIFNSFIKLCIQGGHRCTEKHLSSWIYDISNQEMLKGILDGVLIGDGMLKKEYNIQLLLTSELLIYDILYISNILGIHNVSIKQGESRNPRNSDIKPNYTLTWLDSRINSDNKIFTQRIKEGNGINNSKRPDLNNFYYHNDIPLNKITFKKSPDTIKVYNLEVENSHSYVTEYGITHNCDCNFATSGDGVFDNEILEYYEQTHIKEPIEKRGSNGELWIWEHPDYTRNYMVHADVARGDGKDYSAFHVIDIEDAKQVAEFHGQVSTKDYGNILVSIATEYNDALLVIENANIGWAVLQVAIDREYRNLYYSPKSDINIVDAYSNKNMNNMSNMTPGFTTSMKTRPMIIQKLEAYTRERSCIIQSKRLIEEMRTFIWKNNKAEAQSGYNDDLVMSFGIGLYVRDTALRLQQAGVDLTKASLNSITKHNYAGFYSNNGNQVRNQWDWNVSNNNEGLTWLL